MTASLLSATGALDADQDYTPPVWSFLVGDLRTGRITTELPILKPTFTAPLNDAGTFTGELNLADPDVADLEPRLTAAAARTFLAVELDGTILYGGPVWSHRYSRSTRRLRLAGAGLWSVFDHRTITNALALNTPAAEAADTVHAQLTLAAIARRLVVQAFTHTGGELPIVHPDGRPITTAIAAEAGTHERTFAGYDLTWLGDALRDLTDVEGGPDLELRPRRRADAPNYLEWVWRLGDPWLTQAGPPWVLEDTDVVDVDVDVDGTAVASRAWGTGQGTQRELVIAHAEDLTRVAGGAPLLEAKTAHRTASDPATVQAHADSTVALRAAPVEAWTVTVRPDAELSPATYAVGDRFTIPITDDEPYLPAGDHPARCLAIGGTGSHLTLTMEPTPGSV